MRILCLLGTLTAVCAAGAVTVTVDTATRYQTILGWGKTNPWLPADPLLRDLCIDRAVNDFGLNRLRFEGVSGNSARQRSWEWTNDNDDPRTINWAGFNTAPVDQRAESWLVPWQRAVRARGETFDLYVSPSFFQGGSSGDVPPWLLSDPQEYAEWAEALLLRLRDRHGITADWYSICNEAGNNNRFTPQVVATMIKALMPRLQARGLPTRIQFPECVNATVSWNYVQAVQDDAEIWKWIGLLSYHWYGGNNQAAMQKLAEFAQPRGLPTAQTEFMDLTINHLYDDLTIGRTSYWEVYGLCGPDYEAALTHSSSSTFNGGPWYWPFRQVSHYVRPGAVRVAATVDDPAVRALVFARDSKVTLVLIGGDGPATLTVAGLPAGTYGRSRSVRQRVFEELGPVTVGAGGCTVDLPAGAVMTLYPRAEGNLPPTVTQWRTEPQFLHLPQARLALLASATDPDLDPLTATWTVTRQPEGAQVTVTPGEGLAAAAEGLTVAGEYAFRVQVSDGAHAVARDLSLRVFDGNQPPVPLDVHNRLPVMVHTAGGQTLLRSAAWDIEHDPVSFHWAVVKQPEGAAAVLETPEKQACRATGMTVAGDYVFRLEVSDPTHTVAVELTVPVLP